MTEPRPGILVGFVAGVGKRTLAGIEELGYTASLLFESWYWSWLAPPAASPCGCRRYSPR